MACFTDKLERGEKEGEGVEQGRIGEMQAHRFKECPDVYCYICRAAFGTDLLLNRVNLPTAPPPRKEFS